MIQPEYISLNNWAGSLLIDYQRYNLPILYDEKKWETWALDLLSISPFRGRNIPTPTQIKAKVKDNKDNQEEWRTWARVVYLIMSEN